MMTLPRLRAALAVHCTLWLATTASASPLIPTIDRAIGTGENTILLAIDFNDGQQKDFVTWSFSYDTVPGDGSVHAALLDLEIQDSSFTYSFTDHGWGIGVDGFKVDDGGIFHEQNIQTSGEPQDWWSFWEAGAEDTEWSFASSGAADVSISPGQLYGFNYEPDWDDPATAPNAIPEPGVVGLLLLGLGLLLWARRR